MSLPDVSFLGIASQALIPGEERQQGIQLGNLPEPSLALPHERCICSSDALLYPQEATPAGGALVRLADRCIRGLGTGCCYLHRDALHASAL